MLASKRAPEQVYKGVDKFWFHVGDRSPDMYSDGPFQTEQEAYYEAVHRMDERDCDTGVIGQGEEIEVNPPDADEVIERICDSISGNYGSEIGEDYLNHHAVSDEQKAELTAAIEDAVAAWMTKHKLWPQFVAIHSTHELTATDRQHTETVTPADG